MSEAIQTKKAVSVSEMARMAGLSRSRFYQLIGTAFPPPVYDAKTRRPFYTASQQQTCLEVRHRNCGIDGRPVLFYARRPMQSVRPQGRRKSKSSSPKSGRRGSQQQDRVPAHRPGCPGEHYRPSSSWLTYSNWTQSGQVDGSIRRIRAVIAPRYQPGSSASGGRKRPG